MHRKITRLEAMESSLSRDRKQALDQSKADYEKIAWQSRDLGKLVDMVPPDLNSPKLKIDSRNLAKEACDGVRAAKILVFWQRNRLFRSSPTRARRPESP